MAYLTAEEADTYIAANKLDTTSWDAAADAKKTVALKIATDIIDRLNYVGVKADPDQENQFPREGDDYVPTAIENACAEIAYSLIDDVDIEQERKNLYVDYEAYSSVKVAYKDGAPLHIVAGVPSSIAWDMLVPYLKSPYMIKIKRDD